MKSIGQTENMSRAVRFSKNAFLKAKEMYENKNENQDSLRIRLFIKGYG